VTFAQTIVRRNRLTPSYIIVTILLIALVVTGSVVSDRFLSWRNVSNLFQQMSVLGLASLGQTFVILLGGIDLSVGSIVSARRQSFLRASLGGAPIWSGSLFLWRSRRPAPSAR
jgi:ribose/xylose/arabinose/galactoside ABC-type transport system permease subunit